MGPVLLAFAALVLFALIGVVKTGQERLNRHGIHKLAWRFLTGQPWHGKPVTDRGWFRPGTRALTVTGHAPRFHFRPRIEQTAMRSGGVAAFILIVYGLLVNAPVTITCLMVAVGLLLVAGCWRAWLRWQRRKHRRTWVEPVHAACAPLAGVPIANPPSSWLQITADENHAVSKAVFELPEGKDYSDPKWKELFVRAASAKLGIEAPDPQWQLIGPMHQLALTRSQPPPGEVALDEVWEYVEQAGPKDLIFGLGKKRAKVDGSLVGDSPHALISMGSGAGKSNLLAFLLLQELRRGSIVMCLDAKWFSHPWLVDLPHVGYARSTAQLHAAMCWLLDELERRTRIATANIDYEGRIHASVGPRLIIAAEEMNLAEGPLKQHWADIRDKDDPKRSPAFTGLGAVSFAGRQVGMHLIAVGQMLSARVLGGGEVRENMGIKCLSRYSPNAWKMQAPEHAMPPPPWAPGRIQLVSASGVRETQVPLVSLARARYEALAGQIGTPPHDMPFVGRLPETGRLALTSGGSDQPERLSHPSEDPPAVSPPVSLKEAVEGRVIPVSLANAHNYRDPKRHPDHPKPVALRGSTYLYDPEELARFYMEKSAV